MIVTQITQQKRDKSKFNIYLDGEYVFALPADDMAYFKIKEGATIPEEKVEFIQTNLIYIKAQDAALHFISYKMRTVEEVRKKLEEKEYLPAVIDKVMGFLEKYGYTNDKEYAKKFIKERLRLNPKGGYMLKMELKQRGIKEQICEEALLEIAPDEVEGALYWLRKKTKNGLDLMDEKKKQKLYAHLGRKGYGYDVIKEAFRLLEGGDE